MNAPTGRNARVTVIERAIAASDLPKSFAMAVSVMTTRKKSNASSIQPRKPAATVTGTSRLQPSTHACDPGHDRVPALRPSSPLLLRANPSKDGDAEPRGYGGLTALLAGPPATYTPAAFFVRGRDEP